MGAQRHLVAARIFPETFEDVCKALHEAGFDPSSYGQHCADVHGDDDDLVEHFLLHGHSERRRFPVTIRISGIQRLRRLRIRNRFYVQNLVGALVGAWASTLERHGTSLLERWSTFDQLGALGGMTYILIADPADRMLERSSHRGGRFLIPVRLDLEPRASDDGPAATHRLIATLDTLADSRLTTGLPAIWSPPPLPDGGGEDEDASAIRPEDAAADTPVLDRAREIGPALRARVAQFLAVLEETVAPGNRSKHWVAGWMPPALAGRGQSWLVRATNRVHGANQEMFERASRLGFQTLDDFDGLLGPDGLLDAHYVYEDGYDHRSLDGILSASVWRAVLSTAAAESPTDRFRSLLRSIKANQTASPLPRAAAAGDAGVPVLNGTVRPPG